MLPVYSAKDQKWTSLTFGCTAKGFSSVIRRMAKQEGVSYDEIERRCQPTKEQTDKREKERQEARMAVEKRLSMVRNAYWNGSNLAVSFPLPGEVNSNE